MKVLIDTNVLVSAALKDKDPEAVILFVVEQPDFDQKDAKFLACALATNAEFFITGDRDFSQAKKLVNTTILSVALFKKLVMITSS